MTKLPAGRVAKLTWTRAGRTRSAFGYTLTVNGKRYRGQFLNRADAQQALDELKAELRAPKPTTSPSTLTFGAAVDRVLGLKARSSAATRRDYVRIARDLKAEFGADTPIVEITPSRIAQY